jgi:hypothetical protein
MPALWKIGEFKPVNLKPLRNRAFDRNEIRRPEIRLQVHESFHRRKR